MGEATAEVSAVRSMDHISIHASRGGSDRCRHRKMKHGQHFNPRFPWGKRHATGPPEIAPVPFQSTLPVGEATRKGPRARHRHRHISIHASRGGSDSIIFTVLIISSDFNPRFPWGKRQKQQRRRLSTSKFQSTLPVGEATSPSCTVPQTRGFQSTLPVGEATRMK